MSGLNIPCTVNVKASNVTIKDDQITTSGQTSFGISLRHTTAVTIDNNTISGRNATSGRLMAGIKDIYGDSAATTIDNNNIAMTGTGIQIDEGLIQGNYIHNMGYLPGDHINGITSNGGTAQLTITGNTIFNQISQTDAIGLFEDFNVQANRTITSNLLAGGGYPIYGGQNAGNTPTYNIKITGNRIATLYFPNGGYWGPLAAWNPTGTGNTWTANIWDNTGQPIP